MVKKIVNFLFSLLMILVLGLHILNFLLPMKYSNIINLACEKNDIDKAIIYSIIKTESGFNPDAISNKGAKGLMQLTDETAFWCAKEMGYEEFNIEDIFSPEVNINLGVWYLKYLTDKTNSKDLAIISYNAGESKVLSWMNDGLISENIEEENKIPYPETKKYLKKVRLFEKLYNMRIKSSN